MTEFTRRQKSRQFRLYFQWDYFFISVNEIEKKDKEGKERKNTDSEKKAGVKMEEIQIF